MIVVDTSVVSLVFKGDPRSDYYLSHVKGQRAVVCFQTIEEMWFGAYKAGWGVSQKNQLALHLRQYEVVWPDPETADISANLRVARESVGLRLNTADAWIAATAIRLSCPLVSDDGDFEGIPQLSLIRMPRP